MRKSPSRADSHSVTTEKTVYSSDGSEAQYRNRKNSINIMRHTNDYGLPAVTVL
jgi:hypothetical protein